MKTALVILALFSTAAHAEQVLDCKEKNVRKPQYADHIVVRLNTDNKNFGDRDLIEMKLTEPYTNGQKVITLDTLYARFGANGTEAKSFAEAQTIQFAGYKDGVGLQFDAYHLTLPISAWNSAESTVEAEGWFQDTEIGAGIYYKFTCQNSIQ